MKIINNLIDLNDNSIQENVIKTAIIMAGGSGERFWPLSKQTNPKQLLKLINPEKTMLEESIDRILGIIPSENIFIITGEKILDNIKSIVKTIPEENIIAEPHKRNTAPCLALASSVIMSKFKSQILNNKNIKIVTAVLTSDHIMTPVEKFQEDVNNALDFAAFNDSIVTIGIKPNTPETGFGYIELGEKIENNIKSETLENYIVNSFKEKPNLETAQKYLLQGNFLWNSGMFFYNLDYFNQELEKNLIEVGGKINQMAEIISSKDKITDGVKLTGDLFSQMPDISIDFGLLEKTKTVNVIKSNFKWDDLGSWDSVEKYLEIIGENAVKGSHIAIESKGNIVYNYSNDKMIAIVGIEDLIIVNSDDVIMVCPKDKAQDVKKIVTELKLQNKNEYL